VGALRLATPTSPYARRLYAPEGHKMARAQARHRRIEARRRRLADAFAGAPLGMRARRYRAAGGRANL